MDSASGIDARARWRVAPHVLMRAWSGEVVAYSDETGHTHHFMDVAAWAFEQLSAGALAETDLLAAALTELEPQPGSDLAVSVRNSLELFRRLGIVEPASAG